MESIQQTTQARIKSLQVREEIEGESPALNTLISLCILLECKELGELGE